MKKTAALIVIGSLVPGLWAAQGGDTPDDGYVAHEWGTFTSVQAGQGAQLVWNPLLTTDLPGFVYDRNRVQAGLAPAGAVALISSKGERPTLQRMETPVIYFYSGQDMTVDVTVDFPDGLVTEWYPQVARFGPVVKSGNASLPLKDTFVDGRSFVQWRDVRILPDARNVPAGFSLKDDGSGSHYFAARETDAALVRVAAKEGIQHDKFLFYRGVGYFESPLRVSIAPSGTTLNLTNAVPEPLRHLMILSIGDGTGAFAISGELPAKGRRDTGLPEAPMPLQQLKREVSERMVAALVTEGLFEREARAMVKTWRDSWFEEKGVRVLYILPRAWTDRVLPLKLDPAPKSLVRVMVGRAELITPPMEQALRQQIARYREGSEAARAQAVKELRALGLGRFAEAATRRVAGQSSDPEFGRAAWDLVQAAAAADRIAARWSAAGK